MPTYRAQVVIPMFTNLPTDVVTNTFHFEDFTPLGFQDAADDITPLLTAFYNNVYSSTFPPPSWFADTDAHINWYDLTNPPPRVPYIKTMAIAAGQVTTVIPTEVAAVCSFQGVPISGQPQARRRGRIYIGGVTDSWMDVSAAAAFPRFKATRLSTLAAACDTLMNAVLTAGYRWSVWSPTDLLSVQVNNGWVDNAPDTQRRRSVDSTSRTLWS